MFFDSLLSSWKDSLEIFKKKNFKLFLLASLNTFRRSFLLLMKKVGPLVGGFWLVYAALFFWGPDIFRQQIPTLFYVMVSFLYFYALLAARPSIERKDMHYFDTYMKKFWAVLAVFLAYNLVYFICSLSFLFPLLFFLWVFAFHYLDSKPSLQSILYSMVTAVKIIFYHLPAFLIFMSSKFLFDYLIIWFRNLKFFGINYLFGQNNIMFFIVDQFCLVLWGLIALFFISVVSIYYTRAKHKNFDFFFKGEK